MKRETTILILCMTTLMITGLLMVYSIGALRSPNALLFFKHLIFLSVGFVGFLVMSRFDYHYLGSPVLLRYIVLGTLLLLGLTFVPGVRLTMGGAARWIGWRFISFQPAELAKFSLVLLLAARLTQNQEKVKGYFTGVVMPFGIAGVFVVIVLAQKDIGIPMIMIATTGIMVWVAGARKLHLIISAAIPVAGLLPLIMHSGYRMARIKAFLDPWSDREDTGFQLIQSMSAFAQGGFWGRGAGAGEQKLGYLPAAHTDFIYAIIGEEFGFVGTVLTLALFALIIYAALRVAANAPDLFGTLLSTGIASLIAVQALFIMAVTLGMLPTKGLPLPFVSYGGSALIVSMTMMGVLVNIGVQAREQTPQRKQTSPRPAVRRPSRAASTPAVAKAKARLG
ncbi:MAG TPA: cell division protein FtsW [Candidatus Hydrogenedentes bacterium]|nr:cell division protein FtsW [Candidatus Hydrogenedentota bacterium]